HPCHRITKIGPKILGISTLRLVYPVLLVIRSFDVGSFWSPLNGAMNSINIHTDPPSKLANISVTHSTIANFFNDWCRVVQRPGSALYRIEVVLFQSGFDCEFK